MFLDIFDDYIFLNLWHVFQAIAFRDLKYFSIFSIHACIVGCTQIFKIDLIQNRSLIWYLYYLVGWRLGKLSSLNYNEDLFSLLLLEQYLASSWTDQFPRSIEQYHPQSRGMTIGATRWLSLRFNWNPISYLIL